MASKYEIYDYSSLGKIDEYNCKATAQTVVVTVGGPSRFVIETWSDNNFAKFKREGNIIKIYLPKNPHVADRLFGIIVRDPMGEYETAYWGLNQNGQKYKFNNEKYTFERGYTPAETVERIKLENGLIRVYKGGKVMTETETVRLDIDVYGGSCQGYIRGINKYRINNGKEQFVGFDNGISATMQMGFKEDDKDYCTNHLLINSNGRPFNDNDEYLYVITIGHLDSSRYYAEVEVKFEAKGVNGSAKLETEHIKFESDGGIQLVNIDLGTDEDCDWGVVGIDEDGDWVHTNYNPLSLSVVCDPIMSVEENKKIRDGDGQRSATIKLDVNGKLLECNVFQSALVNQPIGVNYSSFICSADDTEIDDLIVTTYGTELKSADDINFSEIYRGGLVVKYKVILKIGKNTSASEKKYSFTLQTDDNTKHIEVTQLSPVTSEEPIQFEHDYHKISLPKGEIPSVYTSANWCIVEIGDTPTANGNRDIYNVDYKIKDGEENIFGMERRCKVVFTNINNTGNPISCVAINETGSEIEPSS